MRTLREDDRLEVQRSKEKLDMHLSALKEHFDSVQIFCTKGLDGIGTLRFVEGKGDWFARYGVAKLWIDEQVFSSEADTSAEPSEDEENTA